MKSKQQHKDKPDWQGMAETTIANSRAQQRKRRDYCFRCKHWLESGAMAWCELAPQECEFEAAEAHPIACHYPKP